jgi:hypothetical protein
MMALLALYARVQAAVLACIHASLMNKKNYLSGKCLIFLPVHSHIPILSPPSYNLYAHEYDNSYGWILK